MRRNSDHCILGLDRIPQSYIYYGLIQRQHRLQAENYLIAERRQHSQKVCCAVNCWSAGSAYKLIIIAF